ncbi:uncharacterized protein BYT42DRAFT_617791 [Radiomyces spectabilis]|uniref:uncharacterized protein n=1 Tax=Radiomyces spectabilis TaxID=64574 RepID=UPI0022211811|nr:uncharacterized protein BYT42DRAFT_617791 [Radiomyces spectabilis]KAI8368251.1 hypothetical protein BYT42DRAFT_617791 [Radiomyces spectabilis]
MHPTQYASLLFCFLAVFVNLSYQQRPGLPSGKDMDFPDCPPNCDCMIITDPTTGQPVAVCVGYGDNLSKGEPAASPSKRRFALARRDSPVPETPDASADFPESVYSEHHDDRSSHNDDNHMSSSNYRPSHSDNSRHSSASVIEFPRIVYLLPVMLAMLVL